MTTSHSLGPNILFDIFFPLTNFLIFSGILYYLLRKPLKQLFISRSEEVEKNIKSASEAFEEAKQRYEKAQKNLAEIEEEKKRLYLKSEVEIEAFRKKSEEQLKQLLARFTSENELRIEEEFRKARLHLKRETLRKVFKETEEKLKKEVNKKEHQTLTDEYLEELIHSKNLILGGESDIKSGGSLFSGAH